MLKKPKTWILLFSILAVRSIIKLYFGSPSSDLLIAQDRVESIENIEFKCPFSLEGWGEKEHNVIDSEVQLKTHLYGRKTSYGSECFQVALTKSLSDDQPDDRFKFTDTKSLETLIQKMMAAIIKPLFPLEHEVKVNILQHKKDLVFYKTTTSINGNDVIYMWSKDVLDKEQVVSFGYTMNIQNSPLKDFEKVASPWIRYIQEVSFAKRAAREDEPLSKQQILRLGI